MDEGELIGLDRIREERDEGGNVSILQNQHCHISHIYVRVVNKITMKDVSNKQQYNKEIIFLLLKYRIHEMKLKHVYKTP